MSTLGNFAQGFVKDTFKTALGILSSSIRAGSAGDLARSTGLPATNIGDITTKLGCSKDNSIALANRFIASTQNPAYSPPSSTNPSEIIVFSRSNKPTAPGSIIKTGGSNLENYDLTSGF